MTAGRLVAAALAAAGCSGPAARGPGSDFPTRREGGRPGVSSIVPMTPAHQFRLWDAAPPEPERG